MAQSSLLLAVCIALVLGVTVNGATNDSTDALFTNGVVRHISITISPENVQSLRTSPRQYVRATLRDGTNSYANVAIHLKGSTGSYRTIDGKPGFTISFDRNALEQRFHGLRKIHLNNSVEDPAYMHELLGGEFFNAAGVPAARVAHAIVEFNGKRLGLYVLKESFTEDFLARHFRHPKGNLYDTGAGHDVDEALRKDLGPNPEDRSDLDALVLAATEPDLTRRWSRLQRVLDMDRMLSFMASEILLGHRDGYCLARNNFRVYHNLDTGRMVFFPHGMDVLLGNPKAMLQPRMNGLIARAIMEIPEGRRAFRQRCAQLFTNHFNVAQMHARVDATATLLKNALPDGEAAALAREAEGLKRRIAERAAEIERQLQTPLLELLQFKDNVATLTGWQPVDVPEGGSLSQPSIDGRPTLAIEAGPITSASWRTKVLLPSGRYRFEASVRTRSVAALKFGKNHGAALRTSIPRPARSKSLMANNEWTPLQIAFETTSNEEEVDLICELRASRGTAWFDQNSLRLVREK